ncbi:hypothetical protein EYF80_031824 [Liparis tanakae]|uniref:Uncharacterized protein n=1 Tax=Liparis tanakae TaxID=230148 RepID=A0A4Z2GXL1_9TELE|nr:hypothetical protein EYF80_031824 [Liparis tanakae]
MLCSTEASFRQVSSAMSSTLLNLGGFIFWMSSLLTVSFLVLSASSTRTSSPCSSLTLAASKPCFSDGIHTSFRADQSACAMGLFRKSLSTKRNFSSSVGAFLDMFGLWWKPNCWRQRIKVNRASLTLLPVLKYVQPIKAFLLHPFNFPHH